MLTTRVRGINSGNSDRVAVVYDKDSLIFVWDEMRPMLERCIEVTRGMLTMELMEVRLSNGEWTAFAVLYNGSLESVLVVGTVEYSSYRAARILACAGKNLHEAMKYFDVLEAWALKNNCQEIEGWCEPSMVKLVRRFGFSTKKVIVSRNLRSKLQ